MQSIQAAELGTRWSNCTKDGKLFKNINEEEPTTISFSAFLKLSVYFFKRPKTAPQEGYKKFGQIWSRQINIAEVLKSLRQDQDTSQKDHVFWIGHSSILLCLKSGTNILLDPVFSNRCSPFRWVGPARCYPPGTTIEHLPPIHIVAISHNHYDHLDEKSLKKIYKEHPNAAFVVPLRMDTHLTQWGIPRSSIITMDWQDEVVLKDVTIGCTPAKHNSRRGLFDGNKVLWCGWCIGWQPDSMESPPAAADDNKVFPVPSPALVRPPEQAIDWSKSKTFYYAGDTGFNEGVFELIRAQFHHVDMAAIPIGAYKPLEIFSSQHIDPASAVKIFKIVNAKKALGVHWGTFNLTFERVDEPLGDLKAALAEEGVSESDFVGIPIGEHLSF